MIPYTWLEQAAERINGHIQKTPLTYDPNNDMYLKWENHQVTGSFKARGALNKVLTLEKWERQRGLVTASAGNHGQGLALAGKLIQAPVVIFASEHAVASKIEAMESLGAQVRLVPGGYGEAEQAGLEYAAAQGMTWISAYNDGQIIAGQGTLGLETLMELPGLPQAVWVVPVGGGGLISGIGAAIKTHSAGGDCSLIGVQSEASPFGYFLYHKGSSEGVIEQPSLADGLAGEIEKDSLTIPLMRRYLDDFVLVSEQAIADAIRYAWNRYQEVLEGAGAAALAAVLSGKVKGRPAVVILSGGNIQPQRHSEITAGATPSKVN
jgi:threonine dehydratase